MYEYCLSICRWKISQTLFFLAITKLSLFRMWVSTTHDQNSQCGLYYRHIHPQTSNPLPIRCDDTRISKNYITMYSVTICFWLVAFNDLHLNLFSPSSVWPHTVLPPISGSQLTNWKSLLQETFKMFHQKFLTVTGLMREISKFCN